MTERLSSVRQRSLPPLDPAALERLALRYAERYATTRARLKRYLERKVFERGFTGAAQPEIDRLAQAMAALGYVDDDAFAAARVRSLHRRGYGTARMVGALRHAGVERAAIDRAVAEEGGDADAAALAFARRRRFGPYAREVADRSTRERQVAAFVRAGHPVDVAVRILAMEPGAGAEDCPDL